MRTGKLGELTTARNLKVVPEPPEGRNMEKNEGEKAAETILVSKAGEKKPDFLKRIKGLQQDRSDLLASQTEYLVQ